MSDPRKLADELDSGITFSNARLAVALRSAADENDRLREALAAASAAVGEPADLAAKFRDERDALSAELDPRGGPMSDPTTTWRDLASDLEQQPNEWRRMYEAERLENDRLREALREGVAINDGCLFDATVSAALDEWADRHRALLAVPEPCAECGGTRRIPMRMLGHPDTTACPVCAVPTEPKEK